MKKKDNEETPKVIRHLFDNYFIQDIEFDIRCSFRKNGIVYDVSDKKIPKELGEIISTLMLTDSVNSQDMSQYNAKGKKGMQEIKRALGNYKNILFEQLQEHLEINN